MAATMSACRASAAAKAPLKASPAPAASFTTALHAGIYNVRACSQIRATGAKGNDDFFHPGLQNNISGFFCIINISNGYTG